MKHHLSSQRRQSGYSLAEMLVVVAIIGLVSLVSVPQFISYQRSNRLKTSMRQVMSDLRIARAQAIALRTQTRIRFISNASRYFVEQQNADGTWSALGRTGNGSGTRELENGITLATPSHLQTATVSGSTYNLVIYLPDGTCQFSGTNTSATFLVRTAHSLSRTSYTVELQAPGFVKAV